jgi:hypothetical protein
MHRKNTLIGFIFQEIFAALATITVCFLLSKEEALGNFVDGHVDYQGTSFATGISALICFTGAGIGLAVAYGNNFFKKSYLFWSSFYLFLMFVGFALSTFCVYADALLYPEFLAWLFYTAEIVVFLFAPVVLLVILMAASGQSRKTKIVEFSFGILLGVGALCVLILRVVLWNSLVSWSGSSKLGDLNFLVFLNVLVGILCGCFTEAGVIGETKENPEEAKVALPAQNPSDN